jgi:hypothetical protein
VRIALPNVGEEIHILPHSDGICVNGCYSVSTALGQLFGQVIPQSTVVVVGSKRFSLESSLAEKTLGDLGFPPGRGGALVYVSLQPCGLRGGMQSDEDEEAEALCARLKTELGRATSSLQCVRDCLLHSS